MEPIKNTNMIQIASIIKLPEEVRRCSERSELIKFFVDTLRNKQNKKFPAKLIAIKLSHLSTADLYYFISVCKDIDNRKGREAMSKFFWWSLRSK